MNLFLFSINVRSFSPAAHFAGTDSGVLSKQRHVNWSNRSPAASQLLTWQHGSNSYIWGRKAHRRKTSLLFSYKNRYTYCRHRASRCTPCFAMHSNWVMRVRYCRTIRLMLMGFCGWLYFWGSALFVLVADSAVKASACGAAPGCWYSRRWASWPGLRWRCTRSTISPSAICHRSRASFGTDKASPSLGRCLWPSKRFVSLLTV